MGWRWVALGGVRRDRVGLVWGGVGKVGVRSARSWLEGVGGDGRGLELVGR